MTTEKKEIPEGKKGKKAEEEEIWGAFLTRVRSIFDAITSIEQGKPALLRQRLKLLDVWLHYWKIDGSWLQLLFYLKALNTNEEQTFHAARVAFEGFYRIANWIPEVAKHTKAEAREALTEELVSKMMVVSIAVMQDVETVSYNMPGYRETYPVYQNDIIDFFSTVGGEFGRKVFKNFTDFTLYYEEQKYFI